MRQRKKKGNILQLFNYDLNAEGKIKQNKRNNLMGKCSNSHC